MRPSKNIFSISVLLFLGLCLLGILYPVLEVVVYRFLVSLHVRKPQVFQIDISRRTVIQVYPNTEEILWSGTTWTNDGESIVIHNSGWQVYAKKMMLIDPKNPVLSSNIQTLEEGNILGLLNELPFTLEDRESLWAACQDENFFFTAKYLDNKYGFRETRLWQDDNLIKTFEPIKFHFNLYETDFNDRPVGWIIEYSHFSPDCRYAIIRKGRDVWLLDTVEKSFNHIFKARQFPNLRDIMIGSNHQEIRPSWASNSHEFIFGDSAYGVEKYDVQSKKRTWLLPPGTTVGGVIEWSKTDKWILTYSGKDMSLISSDGRMITNLEGCESIEHPFLSAKDVGISTANVDWSPTDDKVAFICRQYQRICIDGKCEKDVRFLIIWDFSNLDVSNP